MHCMRLFASRLEVWLCLNSAQTRGRCSCQVAHKSSFLQCLESKGSTSQQGPEYDHLICDQSHTSQSNTICPKSLLPPCCHKTTCEQHYATLVLKDKAHFSHVKVHRKMCACCMWGQAKAWTGVAYHSPTTDVYSQPGTQYDSSCSEHLWAFAQGSGRMSEHKKYRL